MRSPITTHILDTATGKPAAGIHVELYAISDSSFIKVGDGVTDADGRVTEGLISESDFKPGTYQVRFATSVYFQRIQSSCFYPEVQVTFNVVADQPHYHIPLLLSPFGYTTYRGS